MTNIDSLLKEALAGGASDLHLTPGLPPVARLDGNLTRLNTRTLTTTDTEAISSQLLNEEKKKAFTAFGEVDTTYHIPDVGMFRINCYRQRGSTGIAVRMLNTRIPTLEELGLPEVLANLARLKRGLILVTGPTGSGKSTTLAAMIDKINIEKQLHIVTLEDPIEYFHQHKKSIISQREIGRDSKSFPNSLRSALRQDPDVILVGEMRDLDTISIAVTAAETGHLVLATLHTSDSSQAVERIIDVFPSTQQRQIRTQLANSLAAIVAQRLVPRKENSGRIAAVEILICTPAVRNLIREGKTHQISWAIQAGFKYGMQTMDKHLLHLYDNGFISKQIALEYALDVEALKTLLK